MPLLCCRPAGKCGTEKRHRYFVVHREWSGIPTRALPSDEAEFFAGARSARPTLLLLSHDMLYNPPKDLEDNQSLDLEGVQA